MGKSVNQHIRGSPFRQEQNSLICSPSSSQKPPSSLWPWLISTEAKFPHYLCSVFPLSLTFSQWNIAPSLRHIITSEIHSAMTTITAAVCSGEIKTAWWGKKWRAESVPCGGKSGIGKEKPLDFKCASHKRFTCLFRYRVAEWELFARVHGRHVRHYGTSFPMFYHNSGCV